MKTRAYVPQPSDAPPQPPGTASAGVSSDVSRADHVHASQTVSVPSASNATPLVEGAATPGVSTAYARGDHVHPAASLAITPATPTRVLGTAFQPNATKGAFVSYCAALSVTNPLIAGTSTALIRLFSDAANPPTTERTRAYLESGVGLAVAVAITQKQTTPLPYMVPAGHYVLLSSTISGTSSAALGVQAEELLG